MMRFLKFASAALLLVSASCSNPYKHLQADETGLASLAYQPVVSKELYRCVVDGKVLFKKFHLSGLLFFKAFEDGSTRAVFQNEMGFSFFDFKWNAKDSFQVMSIIPQLNKPALVKTLKKDMNLVLRKQVNPSTEQRFRLKDETYFRFTLDKGYAYYITQNGKLQRIENAGKRKVITIELNDLQGDHKLPANMLFRHHKAHFTIDMKKIEQDAG